MCVLYPFQSFYSVCSENVWITDIEDYWLIFIVYDVYLASLHLARLDVFIDVYLTVAEYTYVWEL